MSIEFEKLTILVVEDTLPMLKLVKSVLESLSVGRILVASDGEEGFEEFCAEKPDIVVADWHMQPISGLDLVKMIRRHPKSPNRTVPIIMMTGYSAMKRVAQARDMGTTEFLVKPFSAEDLIKRITHVINSPRNFVQTGDFFGPDRRRRKIEDYTGPKRRTEDKKNQ